MSREADLKLLAMLVHEGHIDVDAARAAVASGEPAQHLVARGIVSAEQWREWRDTEAGTRPKLARYELADLLGEGGQARVFRAVDRTTGDTVALKVLKPSLSQKPAVVKQFVEEARLLMDLQCENIVQGFRVARDGDVFFCAMELVDGVCLQDRLGDGDRLGEDDALDVVMQVAKALAHLHERGLVHRDVKPGNILWTTDRRAVLIDLGFAVQKDAIAEDAAASDSTAGTVHYIAPEQAKGASGLDARADIYSLGATLYHLLTGSLPFSGESSQEVMAKQVLEALSGDAIRELDLSPQVHYFIEKMMAKEREIRFQDPGELIDEVSAYLVRRRHEQGREQERSAPSGGFRRTRSSTVRRRRRR